MSGLLVEEYGRRAVVGDGVGFVLIPPAAKADDVQRGRARHNHLLAIRELRGAAVERRSRIGSGRLTPPSTHKRTSGLAQVEGTSAGTAATHAIQFKASHILRADVRWTPGPSNSIPLGTSLIQPSLAADLLARSKRDCVNHDRPLRACLASPFIVL